MADEHVPDEILMQRILTTLNRGPMTVAGVSIAINEKPQFVRQGLYDLMHAGKVVQHTDERSYKRAGTGYSPGPTGGDAA